MGKWADLVYGWPLIHISKHSLCRLFGTHVESWTSPLFYTRFHTLSTFMDHGQWSTIVHKLFFLHFEKSHVESWTHKDKKSCPIEQDIVLTGSMIVNEISMQ